MSKLITFVAISFSALFSAVFSNSPPSNQHKNKTPCTELLDQAIVINLTRHFYRYEKTKKLMEEAGFTNIVRFEAVDGFFTEDAFFEDMNIHCIGKGKQGCAASHLLVWREFFENPSSKEFLFICEDDMLPHSNFAQLFPLYWSKTNEDFDILFVGNELEENDSKELIVQIPSFCLHAYIVSKSGAKKLYDLYMEISKSHPSHYVIDVFLKRAMRRQKIKYYCFNGKKYPDLINKEKGLIWGGRDTGICFQNKRLGSSINAPVITYK